MALLAQPSPIQVQAYEPPPVVESLQDKANRIALEVGISTTTISNLINSETGGTWDSTLDNGHDRGLCQINRAAWPNITDDMAFNTEFCLHWTAQKILNGDSYKWVVCNCYSYIKANRIHNLPLMKDIIPNSPPRKGGVAIMWYKGIEHLSYIKDVSGSVLSLDEANFHPCLVAPREISIDDSHLQGVWYPQ